MITLSAIRDARSLFKGSDQVVVPRQRGETTESVVRAVEPEADDAPACGCHPACHELGVHAPRPSG